MATNNILNNTSTPFLTKGDFSTYFSGVCHSGSRTSTSLVGTIVNHGTKNDTIGASLTIKKSIGSVAVDDGDALGNIGFLADDGSTYHVRGSNLQGYVDGVVAAGNVPGSLIYDVRASTGAILTPFTINNLGNVIVAAALSGDSLAVKGSMTATTAITATEDVRARTLFASGDKGSGINLTTALTNVTNTAVNDVGVFTIKSKSATNMDSSGFIKIYIGATPYWIPIFLPTP